MFEWVCESFFGVLILDLFYLMFVVNWLWGYVNMRVNKLMMIVFVIEDIFDIVSILWGFMEYFYFFYMLWCYFLNLVFVCFKFYLIIVLVFLYSYMCILKLYYRSYLWNI